MANPTTNFGWVMPTSTSLVTNLPADFNTFGQGVDTSMAQLKGGTTGQILSKTSATDMAFTWITNDVGDITAVTAGTGISGGGTSGAVTVTNSMATAITTAGDLIKGTGSGTFDRLGIGSSGQVLTVSSGDPAWVTPAGGCGKVLQVVSATYGTQVNIATSTFTDTGLTATITPTSSTSKILIMITTVCRLPNSRGGSGVLEVGSDAKILRGSTNIYETTGSGFMYQYLDSIVEMGTKRMAAIHYYDSPATTSSTTYKLQANMTTTTGNIFFQSGGSGGTGSIILLEIGA